MNRYKNPYTPLSEEELTNRMLIPQEWPDRPFADLVEAAGGINIYGDVDESDTRWLKLVREAMEYCYISGLFTDRLKDLSNFEQSFEHNNVKMRPFRTAVTALAGDVFGNDALRLLEDDESNSGRPKYPLYASGIWISFNRPTNDELTTFEESIRNMKVAVGNTTNGIIHTHNNVMIADATLEFICRFIADTNLKSDAQKIIKELIKVKDYPQLLNAFASTVYPNGYPVSIPCTSRFNKCKSVDTFNLNLDTLGVHDLSMLSNDARDFMSDRGTTKRTIKEVRKYQSELECNGSKEVNIFKSETKEIFISIKSPSMKDWIVQGKKWVTSIESFFKSAMAEEEDQTKRLSFMERLASSIRLTEFSHFVEHFRVVTYTDAGESESFIKRPDDIFNALRKYSGSHIVTDTLMEAFVNEIQDQTITIHAVPKHTCKKCRAAEVAKAKAEAAKAKQEDLPEEPKEEAEDLTDEQIKAKEVEEELFAIDVWKEFFGMTRLYLVSRT